MLIRQNFKKIAVIGFGGFAKEITYNLPKELYDFHIHQKLILPHQLVKPIESINFYHQQILLAIGDPLVRKSIVTSFPSYTQYYTYIDPHSKILDTKNISIGNGSVICAGSILTSNIQLGPFSQINLNSTIGHDCVIGDFFTTAPGVHVSGNCNIGNYNYFGTNSSIKQGLTTVDNVTIGMGSIVLNNIQESGVYAKNPLVKIK